MQADDGQQGRCRRHLPQAPVSDLRRPMKDEASRASFDATQSHLGVRSVDKDGSAGAAACGSRARGSWEPSLLTVTATRGQIVAHPIP
jgi:predicted pyridoxine 5'-phosphate oxidase superfamily flavin-nucleotide-binding protein